MQYLAQMPIPSLTAAVLNLPFAGADLYRADRWDQIRTVRIVFEDR